MFRRRRKFIPPGRVGGGNNTSGARPSSRGGGSGDQKTAITGLVGKENSSAAAPHPPPPPSIPPPGPVLSSARPIKKRIVKFRPPAKRSKNPLHTNVVGTELGNTQVGVSKPSTKSEYYEVMYTKQSRKKHKTYQDGLLILTSKNRATLQDMEGKQIGFTRFKFQRMKVEETLLLGKWEVEVVRSMAEDEYTSGSFFVSSTVAQPAGQSLFRAAIGRCPVGNNHLTSKPKTSSTNHLQRKKRVGASLGRQPKSNKRQRPGKSAEKQFPADATILEQGGQKVVLDRHLARCMKAHQVEGASLLWGCLSGLRGKGRGAILADAMGLGKTLTAIATCWTMLKQTQAVKKVVIVTPASLVKNWDQELLKWLGKERLRPAVVSGGGKDAESTVRGFVYGRAAVQAALIISYEMFRKHQVLIHQIKKGMLVCDEGHRLKSSTLTKTMQALSKFPSRLRLILTGTPVQNNLEEYWAMINFVNPTVLGSVEAFRRVFVKPIDAARDKRATESERELGKSRSQQLAKITAQFVVRRSSSLLKKLLPPKTTFSVFCRLSPVQQTIYQEFLGSTTVQKLLRSISVHGTKAAVSNPLTLITQLRKLCNHPKLLRSSASGPDSLGLSCPANSDAAMQTQEVGKCSSRGVGGDVRGPMQAKDSGKMMFLQTLLQRINAATGDKVVLVSNYTQSLDVIQDMCAQQKWKWLRLDGQTDQKRRVEMVNHFNSSRGKDVFVFLLSSLAGGVGLNLVGANRLVLFDPAWNPAHDEQAMARVWRYGQTKPVCIYRLFSTGTIEEKIYQRQISKQELAVSVVDTTEVGSNRRQQRKFSAEELRGLFTLVGDTDCDTADLIGAKLGWAAYNGPSTIPDGPLRSAAEFDLTVSYVRSELICEDDNDNNDGKCCDGGVASSNGTVANGIGAAVCSSSSSNTNVSHGSSEGMVSGIQLPAVKPCRSDTGTESLVVNRADMSKPIKRKMRVTVSSDDDSSVDFKNGGSGRGAEGKNGGSACDSDDSYQLSLSDED